MRIFLSYAAEHKSVAEPIAFSLRSRGHHVFLDRDDLPPGGSFDDRIQKEIERSDIMIFLISPSSVAQGRYTRTELEFARATWRHPASRVLPVMIEPTPISDVPSFLKGVTILEPQGSVTAEVAAATERLRGSNIAIETAAKGAAIAGAFAVAAWSISTICFALEIESPSFIWLSGLPFCGIMWLLGRRFSPATFAPIATLAATIFIAMSVIGPIHFFESIDTSFLIQTDNASDPSSESTDATTDPDDERHTVLEKIDRMNERSKLLNHAAGTALMGAIGLIGVFLGATWATPEINSPGRWMGSIVAVTLAMSLAGAMWWALFYEPGFLGGLKPAVLTIYSWFPITGAILGYWIGRGRPS